MMRCTLAPLKYFSPRASRSISLKVVVVLLLLLLVVVVSVVTFCKTRKLQDIQCSYIQMAHIQ